MQYDSITPEEIGISIDKSNEQNLFKWFLLSILFGKPLHKTVVIKAYQQFIESGIDSIDILLNTSWDDLVRILDEGSYARFDFSTASRLHEIAAEIKNKYGNLVGLVESSKDSHELTGRLTSIKGIGTVTAGIFVSGLDISGIL